MPDTVTVPDASDLVILTAGEVSVVVDPTAGGRIGQITVAGEPLLVDMATNNGHPMAWGSFPMAPWVGRVRAGQFAFGGVEHRLEINHVDGVGGPGRSHSIHGTVFTRPWSVVDHSATAITMSCPLAGALDWPFGGSVTQTVALFDDRVVSTLHVEATADSFPAEIGWHPWFRKPDRLEFSPAQMYETDEFGLPTGELVEPCEGPWDDCFINTEPIVLHYQRPIVPTVTVRSGCDHVVVYDQPTDATCVEPQSGPPDAFNLSPHVVDPATPLLRTMTISW